jgi:peptide/nickel transport system ATP-binding protein
MSEALLDIRNLSVSIPTASRSVAAVSDVSLALRPGEIVGLVGESGAGKTMIARAVTALLPSAAETTGEILFGGHDVLAMSDRQLAQHRGAGAALCFQGPRRALSPFRQVGHQLADRLEAHRARVPVESSPAQRLSSVGIRNPEQRVHAYPHELSGGMAQRVMIALALSCYPALLVADEPTTGLDVTLTKSILRLFRKAADEDERAVLIISHDVASIAEVCDRVAVMYGGMLVEDGPIRTVLARPAHPYTKALLDAVPDLEGGPVRVLPGSMPQFSDPPDACPFVARCPLAIERCARERPPVRPVAGRLVACFRAEEQVALDDDHRRAPHPVASAERADAQALGRPVLVVEDLEVVHGSRFGKGGHRALDGVTLHVRAGETLGVVGESGCGKTTLARAALALVKPSAGRVVFDGADLGSLGARELRRLRPRMQMVFQDPVDSLDPRRSIRGTLRDSLRLLELPVGEAEHRIDDILLRVGLEPSLASRRRDEVSGGQAQRAGIARGLVLDPDLVIFDEPTAALDVTIQAQILELIRELMEAKRRAYIYVSHDLATVRQVSDRIAVLYLGRVVEEAPAGKLFENPLHPYTRALLSGVPSLRGSSVARGVELSRDLEDTTASAGCVLAPRCPFAMPRCVEEKQVLVPYEDGHTAACWRVPEIT